MRRIPHPAVDPHLPRLLYSRLESAYKISVSVRALDYLIAAGRLETRKIGGRILIPHDELVRFANSDRTKVMVPPSKSSEDRQVS